MGELEVIRTKADAAIALVRFGTDLKLSEAEALVAEVERLRAVLGFYADPGTYWAMDYAFDPPTGGFDDDLEDLSETGPEYGYRFGKRARAALGVSGFEADGLAALEAGDG